MPGRGQYWKKGGLIDETVKEEDLSQALQSKVNSGGGYDLIEDEGTPLTQRSEINFVGEGVVASDDGEKTVVTIAGGGGGGKFYAGVHWGSGAITSSAGSFSPLLGVDGFVVGETTDSVAGNFGRAVKVTKVVITVNQHATGDSEIRLRKNGSTVKTYTFDETSVGTIITDTTETSFNSTDLISWDLVDDFGGVSVWTVIVEYDFS